MHVHVHVHVHACILPYQSRWTKRTGNCVMQQMAAFQGLLVLSWLCSWEHWCPPTRCTCFFRSYIHTIVYLCLQRNIHKFMYHNAPLCRFLWYHAHTCIKLIIIKSNRRCSLIINVIRIGVYLPVTIVKQTLLTPYRRRAPIGHDTSSWPGNADNKELN